MDVSATLVLSQIKQHLVSSGRAAFKLSSNGLQASLHFRAD
jgi:hypothetical protein